jgi:hypothetical protein
MHKSRLQIDRAAVLPGGALALSLAFLLMAACVKADGQPAPSTSGPGTSQPPVVQGLPRSSLKGYVFHRAPVDASVLAADALDPAALQTLLQTEGFRWGDQQRFTARGKALTEVIARELGFDSQDGAGAYLAWLSAHGKDLLGSRTKPGIPPAISGAVAFTHAPSGCCTKDSFQYFVAWRRGAEVLTLLLSGPHARASVAVPLIEALDAGRAQVSS